MHSGASLGLYRAGRSELPSLERRLTPEIEPLSRRSRHSNSDAGELDFTFRTRDRPCAAVFIVMSP
jgi:hypothetical protein